MLAQQEESVGGLLGGCGDEIDVAQHGEPLHVLRPRVGQIDCIVAGQLRQWRFERQRSKGIPV